MAMLWLIYEGSFSAERLPFEVQLDDVAGRADNVFAVCRRAYAVSEPADPRQKCSGGADYISCPDQKWRLLLPVLLHMEATALGLLLG
jgi:hypothetical protein